MRQVSHVAFAGGKVRYFFHCFPSWSLETCLCRRWASSRSPRFFMTAERNAMTWIVLPTGKSVYSFYKSDTILALERGN